MARMTLKDLHSQMIIENAIKDTAIEDLRERVEALERRQPEAHVWDEAAHITVRGLQRMAAATNESWITPTTRIVRAFTGFSLAGARKVIERFQ